MKKNANQKSKPGNLAAFTLIELLVVISIIAVLAAFSIPVMTAVKRQQYLKVARGEMEQVATALENYKAKYGVYPPAGTNSMISPLYYELLGTATSAGGGTYTNLDNSGKIDSTALSDAFGIGGLINSTKGGGEDSTPAKSFLPSLNANRIGTNNANVKILITSAGGPDQKYLLALESAGLYGNPFRYNYPGTNNLNSYDLWVDLVIKGRTNRISNWSESPQIIQ